MANSVQLNLPATLLEYAGNSEPIQLTAATVRGALLELQQLHPSVYVCVCDETGAMRKHLNLFVNSDWVPGDELLQSERPLRPGDTLTIWTAVSGG